VAEPLVINAMVTTGVALLAFAGLSFLGLGVQPPSYDWGRMLDEGLDRIYSNPAAALAPGVAIILAGLTFNLVGDSVAQVLGHRDRHQRRGGTSPDLTATPHDHTSHDVGPDMPLLHVAELSVMLPDGIPEVALVHDVSFDVHAGEAIGIVGESGSGKSLTVMSIAQLVQHPLRVHAGRLEFMGQDLRRAPTPEIRRLLGTGLGVVFQDPASALNPTMRVGRQLSEVAETHLHLDRSAAAAMAIDRLRAVRISAPDECARQYPHELSGGMRQRAMLGIALMGTPRLLIADEPTTGLDVTIQAQILDLLDSVRSETQAAVLLVSHDIAVISGFCDRVLVMYAGTLVEDMPVERLLSGPAHPYTEALIATVPELTGDRSRPLATIPGRQPEPHSRPGGCPFSPRCAYATSKCAEVPEAQVLEDGHRVACWHPLKVAVRGNRPTEVAAEP
jgi:oligopeptide/dipeptide ABC transporter ATP-binding protein